MGALELIALVLIIFWLGGFFLHLAGGLIHILLIAAIILLAARFLRRGV